MYTKALQKVPENVNGMSGNNNKKKLFTILILFS